MSERKHYDGLPFGGVRNTHGWVHDVGLDFRKMWELVSYFSEVVRIFYKFPKVNSFF